MKTYTIRTIKKIIFILCLICINKLIYSQALLLDWQKSYGGNAFDYANDIQQTADGGFIVVGFSTSNDGDVSGNHGGRDFWVVKLDTTKNISWQISLGGSGDDAPAMVRQVFDGGYIIVGTTSSNYGNITGYHGGEGDIWLVKLSSEGVLQWQKCYGGSDFDYATSMDLTNEGGYIIGGSTASTDGDVTVNHGSFDSWVMKLDLLGNIIWQKTLGGTSSDGGCIVKRGTGSNFIVAASGSSVIGNSNGNHGAYDYWVLNLSATGNIQYQFSYGGLVDDEPSALAIASNGDIIVAGYSKSADGDISDHHGPAGIADFWVIRLNKYGVLQWSHSYGGSSMDVAASILQTNDGGFIITGYASSIDGDVTNLHGTLPGDPDGAPDYWVIRINSKGDLLWQKTYGGNGADYARSIIETSNGKYIIAGTTGSNDGDVTFNHSYDYEYWILQLSDACRLPNAPVTINSAGGFYHVCPGDVRTYSTPLKPGVTYDWDVPLGATILNGQGTNNINVIYDSNLVDLSYINVKTQNSCGVSSPVAYEMIKNKLGPPGTIFISGGSAKVCPGDARTYSMAPATGTGITYFWTVPAGATITGGQGTTSINVIYDNSFISNGVLTAYKVNGCGMSGRHIIIIRDFTRPSTPSLISGDNRVCPGDTLVYSVFADAAVSFVWTVSGKINIVDGQGTNSIKVLINSGFSYGYVAVVKKNNCNISLTRSRNIFLEPNPSIPSLITGNEYGLCGARHVVFSVQNTPGLIYNWTVPGLANIVSGQGSNSITVNFQSVNFLKTISVTASSRCGTSKTRNLIIRSAPQIPENIIGNTTVCSGSIGSIYSITAVSSAINYSWVAPTGAVITANGISSTTNMLTTTSEIVSIDFGNVSSGAVISVRANNDCGTSGVRTMPLLTCTSRLMKMENATAVYPNPCKEYINITIPDKACSITINDMAGRVLEKISIDNVQVNSVYQINMSNFTPGIYLLIINTGKENERYFIVKE